jgi:hypothetical protein
MICDHRRHPRKIPALRVVTHSDMEQLANLAVQNARRK